MEAIATVIIAALVIEALFSPIRDIVRAWRSKPTHCHCHKEKENE